MRAAIALLFMTASCLPLSLRTEPLPTNEGDAAPPAPNSSDGGVSASEAGTPDRPHDVPIDQMREQSSDTRRPDVEPDLPAQPNGPPCAAPCPAPKICVAGTCTCPASNCNPDGRACGPNGGTIRCEMEGGCLKPGVEVPCTATNGSARCKDSVCQIASCNTGHQICGGECKRTDDSAFCLNAFNVCERCAGWPNASATCAGNRCVQTCFPGFALCESNYRCERTRWNFESGMHEGVAAHGSLGFGSVVTTAHSGAAGLGATSNQDVSFNVSPPCGASAPKTFSAWVYVDSTNVVTCVIEIGVGDTPTTSPRVTMQNRVWQKLVAPFPPGPANRLSIFCNAMAGPQFEMVIDDLLIE